MLAMIDWILRLSAGFAVTGHVDGARRSHVYVSEVNPEGAGIYWR